jgi:hypothetical protein
MWLYKVLFIHPEQQNTHNIFIVIVVHFCILFVSFCAHRTYETMPLKPHPVATPTRVGERSSFVEAQLYVTTLFYVCVQELLHYSYCIELNIFTISENWINSIKTYVTSNWHIKTITLSLSIRLI